MIRGLAPLTAMLTLPAGASATLAEARCLAGEYRLPASIGEEIRPYLVCGIMQGDGHHGTRINGREVSRRGPGLEACGTIRSSAVQASERRLASTMPDPAERRRFVEREFANADRFLAAAARSEDLAVGEEPSAPPCRNAHAGN
ncbi:MAG TPA: hypothetical protein VD846_01965 [Allosphingosinicella sp.]|nr:hypothetical protein [Allosphingosinicella sp.]